MTEACIRPATMEAAYAVAANMRDEDARELRDLHGLGPAQGVLMAMTASGEAFEAWGDGVPVAIFGCATVSVLPMVGSPWLLGTNRSNATRKMLTSKFARKLVGGWRERYGLLENHVDARNAASIRWLRGVGFSFDPPQLVRPGIYARRFHMD